LEYGHSLPLVRRRILRLALILRDHVFGNVHHVGLRVLIASHDFPTQHPHRIDEYLYNMKHENISDDID
jgi:hypothetical protein